MNAMRLSSTTDAELLASAPEHPEAFGAFYDRYEKPALKLFYRGGRDQLADVGVRRTAECSGPYCRPT